MAISAVIARLSRLKPRDLALLVEALAALAAASAAVRLLPFRKTARLASIRQAPRRNAPGAEAAARVRWAVEAWARRVPWRAVCFQVGLATHWMLRRRGAASVLHYGVGRPEDELSAHVWVTLAGKTVVGEFEDGRFVRLASFPASRAEAGGATSD